MSCSMRASSSSKATIRPAAAKVEAVPASIDLSSGLRMMRRSLTNGLHSNTTALEVKETALVLWLSPGSGSASPCQGDCLLASNSEAAVKGLRRASRSAAPINPNYVRGGPAAGRRQNGCSDQQASSTLTTISAISSVRRSIYSQGY